MRLEQRKEVAAQGARLGIYRTINHGMRPLGSITGGLIVAVIGQRGALWIGATGALACALWLMG